MNTKKQPHLIIFNPDQWRSDAMGHMGNPAVQTPNLDTLVANEAVSFRNAFCQNPVCTPSRCSFMSGLYPHTFGHRTMFHMLHPERGQPNMLKILKDQGYFVWWGGKNDLVPGQGGYDDYCDVFFKPQEEDYQRWGYEPQEDTHSGDLKWRGEHGEDNFFSFMKGKLDKGDKDIYCDHDWSMILGARDLIRNYQGEKPLCIFLPIHYPHPPYCVEEPWYSLTDRNKVPDRTLPPEDWSSKPATLKPLPITWD